MTEMQILTKVEIPLSLPLIIGGLRAGVLQVIATVVIASYVGLGGLGRIIASGIGLNDYDRILGGAILITALALLSTASSPSSSDSRRRRVSAAHARLRRQSLRRRAHGPSTTVGTPIQEGKS